MTLNEFQNTINGFYAHRDMNREQIPGLAYCALGLTGEAGEVAEKVKKLYRDDNGILSTERSIAIVKELGDVLNYLTAIATQLGTTLEWIAQVNIAKITDRQVRGVRGGDGDDR